MADDNQDHDDGNMPDTDTDTGGKDRTVDAMGLDKRRGVVGGQYGATARKQLTVYGIFIAVVLFVGIVGLTVISNYDGREIPLDNTAPWAKAETSIKPRPLDFPRNGSDPNATIPLDEIGAGNVELPVQSGQ